MACAFADGSVLTCLVSECARGARPTAGFDVDDAVAICLGNALHMNGEAELLAVIHDTGCDLGAGGVSALNHFYGHDNITIGAWKGKYGSDCTTHFKGADGQDQYLSKIINNPAMAGPIKSSKQALLGTDAYRKVLAAAPNASVNVASIGMPTNLRDLLATKPDQYSSMDGYDLIAAKVNKIVFMDGEWHERVRLCVCGMCVRACVQWHCLSFIVGAQEWCSTSSCTGAWSSTWRQCLTQVRPSCRDVRLLARASCPLVSIRTYSMATGMYNFGCATGLIGPADDCYGSAEAALKMPPNVRLVFSNKGASPDIYTGQDLQHTHPDNSPCREALKLWCCNPNGQGGVTEGRLSWDPITVMIAALDVGSVYEKEVNYGTQVTADADGEEHFFGSGTKNAQTDFNGSPNVAGISGAINQRVNQVPPPQPPQSSDGYVRGDGLNCWPGHGADDIPTTSSPMDLHDCEALCNSTAACTGVVTQPYAGGPQLSCYMKKNIDWGSCDVSTVFTTWVRGDYVKGGGFNCYGSRNGQPAHGAVDLESPPDASCGVMTVAECEAKCSSTPQCDGVTTSDAGAGKVNCFRKADIDLSECDHGTPFDTFKSHPH